MIQKKNPKVYNIDSYIEDVPIFKVNFTSFFHFVNIISVGYKSGIDGIDFTKFSIIGSKAYYTNFLHSNIRSISHWIYGPCNNSSDLGEIGKLIKYDFFSKCACISMKIIRIISFRTYNSKFSKINSIYSRSWPNSDNIYKMEK